MTKFFLNNLHTAPMKYFFIVFLILFTVACKKTITDPKPLDATKSTWPMVGTPLTPNSINCLYLDGSGNLYAAGSILYSSSIYGYPYSCSSVMKWNGSAWSQLGPSSLNANSAINTLCGDAIGNIYAAGQFTDSTFVSSYWCHPDGNNYVAKWNGTTWTMLGSKGSINAHNGNINSIIINPINGYLYATTYSYPVTNYDVEFWNGNSWHVLDSASAKLNGTIVKLCFDNGGNLYAGGYFKNSNGNYYVAKWSGTGWIELGGGNLLNANNGIYSICCDASGNLYAAGSFTNMNGKYYVAKWDGTNWTELGGMNGLNANGMITTMCIDATGNLYAGGAFNYKVTPFLDITYYVAKWNGSSWSILGQNTLFATGHFNCLIPNSSGGIYATGTFMDGNRVCYVGRYP